ncbi:DUF4255 domain-containing protein [Nitriliruptor alkaliphilus]|uniref:DUF4255 domain-containing protein n=1 Tax=Nitriliruptor alkaliphilus TaxID=427918 RepID=UPI000696B95D|nr:DUF4255 domain-containing protein [Nitriliruptor alkaliphilus]
MIHDLDASIRALIRRDAVNGGDVEVAFDAPTREWAAKRSQPTVDVYLFDIREDVVRRRVQREPLRDDEGVVIGRRRPPRRYRLSYLVTAWTQRPEDEHRLLSSVLHTFLPHEELPEDVLEGSLATAGQPIFLTIGLPPPPERSIGEIWSAMGGELKPSLELVISAPFVLAETRHAGPPVEEQPRFTFDGAGTSETRSGRPRVVPGGGEDQGPEIEETIVAGKDDKGRVLTIRTFDR